MRRFFSSIGISLLLLFGLSPGCGKSESPLDVDVTQLRQAMSTSDVLVLDVRTEAELTGMLGSLEGIIHIPVTELQNRYDELKDYKEQTVYIICRSGNRSRTARAILLDQGYKALNVLGGMRAWRKEFGEAKR